MQNPLRYFFLLIIFQWSAALEGIAQNLELDSLKSQVENAKSDSDRIKWKIPYAVQLAKIDFPKALQELESAKQLSLENNFPWLQANAALNIGVIYYDRGDYIKCILAYEEASRLYSTITTGTDQAWGLAAALINLGAAYSLINDWQTAQEYYQKGIIELEKLKDSVASMISYFNLAFIFIDIQEWEKAYQYLVKAATFCDGSDNYDSNLQVTARLAAICSRMNRKKEARKWLSISDSLLRMPIKNLGRTYYHHAYAEYNFFNKDYQKALSFHRNAYHYAQLWRDPYFVADEAREIGQIYLKLNQIDSAKHFLSLALDTSTAYQFLPKIRIVLNDWCEFYADNQQFQKAYEYRTYLNKFTDSIIVLQNHNRIFLLDTKYQTEKKEQQIKQLELDKKIQQLSLNQKSVLNYVFLGSTMALLFIGTLVYRNFRNKHILSQQTEQLQTQRIRELEQEKQLVAYNALLKGQEEERSRLAKDLHDGLGGMLSGVKLSLAAMKGNMILSEATAHLFTRALEQLDNSIGEMRRVAHNMMPEALVRLGLQQAIQDFCDNLNDSHQLVISCQFHGLEKRPDPATEIVIYRIVQELLNNVVKHANATEALVQLMRHENNLNITVEDNGKGFDPEGLTYHRGAGLSNVRSRVDYLKGQIDIQSDINKGTSIHIECIIQDQ